MSHALIKVNPKNTTQSALLEQFAAQWRTKMVKPFITGRRVLDFGCGEHLWTLKSLKDHAEVLCGYDILYQGLPKQTIDGMFIYGEIQQIDIQIDRIIALACFEHIEPELLPSILDELYHRTSPDALIVGTVPRPPAKPVLEFLSYKLGLIDKSQIRDHKIYYDKLSLMERVQKTKWNLYSYRTFQFGMNSLFVLGKTRGNS